MVSAKDIEKHVYNKITGILHSSAALKKCAVLRGGLGKSPGEVPAIFEHTLDGLPGGAFTGTDEEEPTAGLWAVHIALVLFGLHQSGHDPKYSSMSKPGVTLGDAVRRLPQVATDDKKDLRRKRLSKALQAATPLTPAYAGEFSRCMEPIIKMLKQKSIPLDYPQFAADIFTLMSADTEKEKEDIKLKWALDFEKKDGWKWAKKSEAL